MQNIVLQAVRRSLFLSVKEVVEHVKTVDDRSMSVRAWQKWESGENPVPADVHCELVVLAGILEQMKFNEINYTYCRTIHEYTEKTGDDNVVTWRMHQAVAAEIMLEELVQHG